MLMDDADRTRFSMMVIYGYVSMLWILLHAR